MSSFFLSSAGIAMPLIPTKLSLIKIFCYLCHKKGDYI